VPTEAGRGGPVSGAAEQDRGDTERGRERGGLAAAVVEREKREKERAGSGTIPAYVRRADTSADEHKRAGLCGGCGTLCSSATRRT
jgi:hypothetical protein